MKKHVEVCKEFIFVIIECINMEISTLCHFHDQKREYDAIFMDSTRMTRLHVNKNSTILNVASTTCKMHHLHIVIQNTIILSFLIIKMTKV